MVTIAYAVHVGPDGTERIPARSYLESEEVSTSDHAYLRHLFLMLGETGRINNQRKFRKERGPIWAFKVRQLRIGAFQVGRVWFLTHGFSKKQDRWRREELERAETIRSGHLAWMGHRRRALER